MSEITGIWCVKGRRTVPSFLHARHSSAQCVLGTHNDRLLTLCYEEETRDSITNITSSIRHYVGQSICAERQLAWLETSRLLENIQRSNRGSCVIWLDTNKLHSFLLYRSLNYVSLQNLVNCKTGLRFTEFGDSPEQLEGSKLSLCDALNIYTKYCNILLIHYSN